MPQDILAYNRRFVEEARYEPYRTDKYPDRKLAILTCMDTRLTQLLPAALGLKNGDANLITNAGGVLSDPFGSEVRSLLVAVYELGVEEILVIGHTDCGARCISGPAMTRLMEARGISAGTIDRLRGRGVDFDRWLSGFATAEQEVARTVELLRQHPLLPADLKIAGYVMDSVTGALQPVDAAGED